MHPLKALIVDDEPLARERLRRMTAASGGVTVVAECKNGREAVDALRQREVDLVFLDIQMPEMDGFEVVEEVGPGRMPVVIFTTAYDEHALRAFEIHALEYLLKPFDADRLQAAVERAVAMVHGRDVAGLRDRLSELIKGSNAVASTETYLERVMIKTRSRIYFVRTAEIDWIEAARNYVRLHVGSRTHLMRQTLSTLEEQLNPDQFMRIHRSAIVNIDRIEDLQPQETGEYDVRLETGTVLTLSRTYKDRLRRFLPE